MVTSLVQFWALYCLVMFYHVVAEDVEIAKRIRPLSKFICVKAVVFFCFWQSLLISGLVSAGIITESENFAGYTQKELASSFQSFIIWCERAVSPLRQEGSPLIVATFSHRLYPPLSPPLCAASRCLWPPSPTRIPSPQA